MMTPAGALMIEHRLIERMVRLMAEQLERVRRRREADPEFLAAAVDFIRLYADQCHHGKEEDILFRALEAKPLDEPLKQILNELTSEHVITRHATGRLAQANQRYRDGDAAALAEIEQRLDELVTLYPRHIEKEDQHFFVPAQECFTTQELGALLDRFWEFDRRLFQEHYREAVARWETAGRAP